MKRCKEWHDSNIQIKKQKAGNPGYSLQSTVGWLYYKCTKSDMMYLNRLLGYPIHYVKKKDEWGKQWIKYAAKCVKEDKKKLFVFCIWLIYHSKLLPKFRNQMSIDERYRLDSEQVIPHMFLDLPVELAVYHQKSINRDVEMTPNKMLRARLEKYACTQQDDLSIPNSFPCVYQRRFIKNWYPHTEVSQKGILRVTLDIVESWTNYKITQQLPLYLSLPKDLLSIINGFV